jgi:integrase
MSATPWRQCPTGESGYDRRHVASIRHAVKPSPNSRGPLGGIRTSAQGSTVEKAATADNESALAFEGILKLLAMACVQAAVVRGPKHSVKEGSTPVLSSDDTRTLLDLIDISTPIGLRDRALIALMTYTFARVGAVIKMQVDDVYAKNRRLWVCLHEKGGKKHDMPAHHSLEEYLHAYLDQAGLESGVLFRSAIARSGQLTDRAMAQQDVYAMIRRRVAVAGIESERSKKTGCHSFRATGITEYLRNGGKLETAQKMANHESSRTTGLYDRRDDQVTLDEVERIRI